MEGVELQQIIDACGATLLWGDPKIKISGITTDSRKSGADTLFIPIAGPTFDGHEFIRAAFDGGAVAALTHRHTDDVVVDHALLAVEDTLKALADIARWYRSRFAIPLAAVTGSVGKTTTKDMCASALASQLSVLKTKGNFNNEIGLPLTLFGLDSSHDIAVVEMGMNHSGEIHRLASIAKPDVAIITNIGMSHIENLGSQQGILQAKLEITDFFRSDSVLILNGDDPLLWECRQKPLYRTLFYGRENPACDYRAENIQKFPQSVEFDAVFAGGCQHIRCSLPGEHNVYNALAAFALAHYFKLAPDQIARGIERFSPSGMRTDIQSFGGITLINDCYNASPASMEAALDVLAGMASKRKAAILGDILEMGEFAPEAHRQVGQYAARSGIDYLFTVGPSASFMAQGAKEEGMGEQDVLHFQTNKQLMAYLPTFLQDGDTVLVKASRGMKFEQICQCIAQLRQIT